jgi:hypothetical protein
MIKTNLLIASTAVVLMAAIRPSFTEQPTAPQRENTAPAEKMAPQKAPAHEAPQNRGDGKTTAKKQSQPSEGNSEQERGRNEHAQDRTTDQPQGGRRDRMGSGSESDHTIGEPRKTDRGGGGNETTGQGAAAARVNIPPEAHTRIHEVIVRERNAPRVESPDFDVSVGAAIPGSVRFAALPAAVLEIEPAWHGFEYFLIGDRMVVVDPRTMKVVAIVDA